MKLTKKDFCLYKDEEYYSIEALSNSALSKLNPEQGGSILAFKNFMEHLVVDSSTEAMTFGTKAHAWFLEPDKCETAHIPIISPKLKSLLDEYYKEANHLPNYLELEENKALLKQCALAVEYGAANWSENTILKNALPNLEYLKVLKKAEDKILISITEEELFVKWKQAIDQEPCNYKLLNLEELRDDTNYQHFVELSVLQNYYQRLCKGKIDEVFIDVDKEKVIIIDYKTTQNSENYKKEFEKWHTYRQLYFYELLLINKLHELTGKSFTAEHYIIALGKQDENATIYKIDKDYIVQGLVEVNKLLARLELLQETIYVRQNPHILCPSA